MGTSTTLHEGLLKSVLGAPVSFFDVTPVGRILNRFSSDIQTIDEDLSSTLSRLGIIPQDPAMFSASVRFNLDPFDQYPDEAVWSVLDSIGMKTYVLNLPNKLNEVVVEG
eukprot:gene44687-55607_t